MAQGIEYALAAMICFGLADFVYKQAAGAGVKAHHFLMLQAWFFAPTVLLYGISSGTLAFGLPALWGAAAGFFVYAGLYCFARSLQGGAVSINAPIFRLSFTITAALAVWLLHEPLTPLKFAGLGLALIATVAAARRRVAPAHRASRASLAQVLVAMLSIGIANFIYKIGLLNGASPRAARRAGGGVYFARYRICVRDRPWSQAAASRAATRGDCCDVARVRLYSADRGARARAGERARAHCADGLCRHLRAWRHCAAGIFWRAQRRGPRDRARRAGVPYQELSKSVHELRDSGSPAPKGSFDYQPFRNIAALVLHRPRKFGFQYFCRVHRPVRVVEVCTRHSPRRPPARSQRSVRRAPGC